MRLSYQKRTPRPDFKVVKATNKTRKEALSEELTNKTKKQQPQKLKSMLVQATDKIMHHRQFLCNVLLGILLLVTLANFYNYLVFNAKEGFRLIQESIQEYFSFAPLNFVTNMACQLPVLRSISYCYPTDKLKVGTHRRSVNMTSFSGEIISFVNMNEMQRLPSTHQLSLGSILYLRKASAVLQGKAKQKHEISDRLRQMSKLFGDGSEIIRDTVLQTSLNLKSVQINTKKFINKLERKKNWIGSDVTFSAKEIELLNFEKILSAIIADFQKASIHMKKTKVTAEDVYSELGAYIKDEDEITAQEQAYWRYLIGNYNSGDAGKELSDYQHDLSEDILAIDHIITDMELAKVYLRSLFYEAKVFEGEFVLDYVETATALKNVVDNLFIQQNGLNKLFELDYDSNES